MQKRDLIMDLGNEKKPQLHEVLFVPQISKSLLIEVTLQKINKIRKCNNTLSHLPFKNDDVTNPEFTEPFKLEKGDDTNAFHLHTHGCLQQANMTMIYSFKQEQDNFCQCKFISPMYGPYISQSFPLIA